MFCTASLKPSSIGALKNVVEPLEDIARRRLEADSSLAERTKLSVDNIVNLLTLCLNATYFTFRGVVYQQVFGTAMGSPVSVVVANLVMEDVEERALRDFSTPIRFWKRYVDDICAAVPKSQVDTLLAHINTIEPSIRFTLERENVEGCLPFLDVLLHHNNDGTLFTSVYRKPTHTDKYLNFDSHHPLMHKVAVVRTLVSRANALCSTSLSTQTELNHIFSALAKNQYPQGVLQRFLKPQSKMVSETQYKTSVTLPYVRGVSEAIKRVLLGVDIRVFFRPHVTLRNLLVHPKDPVPAGQKANVVYNIPCLSCPRSYIGQTARLLDTRVKEHKATVKKGETATSAVAEHVWEEHHQMDFSNVTVLAREANKDQRCCLESWFIQRNSTINRELGTLPSVYNSLHF